MKLVWICPFTDKEYDYNSPELAGYGEPPVSPDTPTGYGGVFMTLTRKEETIEETE
jgi:hypothetical protein